MHFSQTPRERSGSWARKKRPRICSGLSGLSASAGRKGHVRRTYSVCAFLEKHSIRGRLDSETCFTRQILEITTDWPLQESLRKNRPGSDFRKSLHVQRLGDVYESQGLVCFLEHRDFDDPGTEDLINEFRGRVGPEACRTAPGYAHGQVRTHGQTLLFYRYRYTVL